MKKKILIITTGGTIAMKFDSAVGIVPSNQLLEFLKSFTQLREVAEIGIYEFSNIPSPHMTPELMFQLAKVIDNEIIKHDGVVITHGTDTLEETSFMLDIVLKTKKPVVLTAAMRSGDEIGLDGPRNIISAVRVAAYDKSHNKGVLVVMNDEIHSAREVVKADTSKVDSFESPRYGITGLVEPDCITFHHPKHQSNKLSIDKINTKVDLIKAVAGMDDGHINWSIERGAAGIVIEAFGRGNVPPNIVPAIERAIRKKIPVIIVSRAYTGRVLPEYGYSGGCKDLLSKGVILGGDLKGTKARIKLMCLLGKYNTIKQIRKHM
jgi:L-asparaginase